MTDRAFRGVLSFIKEKYPKISQKKISQHLGIQQPQVSQYQTSAPARISWWKKIAGKLYQRGYRDGQIAATQSLMSAIVDTFGEIPQSDMAKALRVTQPTISNWLNGTSSPSKTNIEKILALQVTRLAEPILEFHEVSPVKSGQSWRIDDNRKVEEKIRKLIQRRIGIYVFYDSAGKVTYLGKTENCFWTEVKQRLKGKVNRSFYNPRKEPSVVQGQITRYLSVYEIRVTEAIHNLEVLMLRAFPNDLANTNVGNFKKGL